MIIAEIKNMMPPGKSFAVADPGCGTGGLALSIGRNFPEAKVTGLELSLVPFTLARFKQKICRIKNVRFLQENFYAYDFSSTDIVVVFLPVPILAKLAPMLAKDLKPGTVILSNVFRLPEPWQPYQEVPLGGVLKRRLYCYRIS